MRAYGRSAGYGRMHLQVRAFYFFATGVLTCKYGRAYGRSTFPFLSNIPYTENKALSILQCTYVRTYVHRNILNIRPYILYMVELIM